MMGQGYFIILKLKELNIFDGIIIKKRGVREWEY